MIRVRSVVSQQVDKKAALREGAPAGAGAEQKNNATRSGWPELKAGISHAGEEC